LQGNQEETLVGSIDIQSALRICEGRGCYLEQWCLYVHRLKSGFSREDFGSLFIYDFPAPLRLDHCALDILISLKNPLLTGSLDHCLLRYPIALLDFLILTCHVLTHI
jgi:hypothetical protein